MKLKNILSAFLGGLMAASVAQAEPQKVDSVLAIVDKGVILSSEVNDIINRVKQGAVLNNQQLPSDAALRAQAIDRLVIKELQLQMAERMGLQISDTQLDQAIGRMASDQSLTIEQFRQRIIDSGENYEKYRETFREEMTAQEAQRLNVHRRVYISLQEIDNLLKLFEESGQSTEEFRLGHILIEIPGDATPEDINASKERADKVIDLLNNGSDFKKLALGSSSGAEALEGGDMGWKNINELPSLFAEVVRSAKKDELIGPIRSGAGFHILKVTDIRGRQTVEVNEVKARHILVKPSIILSESNAKKMLAEFADKLNAGEANFSELAKEHSEDPGSALKDGVLDWADPNIYVPAFRDQVNKLDAGVVSQPFRSSHGWHIVEVIERRTSDATAEHKRDRAYNLLYNRKFNEESENWLREIRDQAFIEIIAE